MEEMVEMKRMTLLLALFSILTILGSSSLQASSPVINDQTATVSMMFSRFLAFFVGTLQDDSYTLTPVVVDTNDDPMLGGDADDYANGKIKPDGSSNIIPPVIVVKNIMK